MIYIADYDAKTIGLKLYAIKLKYKSGYRTVSSYKYHQSK